jgi:hypothetical protein
MNDPNDRKSWSGTQYYMARALERHCEHVECLGPMQPFALKATRYVRYATKLLTGKRYLGPKSLARKLAKAAERKLLGGSYDVIFAPAGSAAVAQLHTHVPIVYLSDATLQAMVNYYPEFTNVLPSQLS